MRPIKPHSRRRPAWQIMLLVLAAVLVGGVGSVFSLAAFKVVDFSKLFGRSRPTHPADWVAVPLSSRSIPAHTLVTRDYLLDPKTGEPVVKWYPPDEACRLSELDMSKVLGRVTAREKPALYYFHESDFFPRGSSPGDAGAIPPGKRAITLDASKVKGCVFDLKEGDHIDLQASISVDMPGTGQGSSGGAGNVTALTPDALLLKKRGLVRPLVQDGVVVSPVTTRLVPIMSSSVMNGATMKNMRVQEIVLAVAPAEVAPLEEAMDMKYQITCVLRSGRAVATAPPASKPTNAAVPAKAKGGDPPKSESPSKERIAADITPGLNPMDDLDILEVMVGQRKQFMVFKGPGHSPVVAAEQDNSPTQSAAASPAGNGAGANE